MTDDAVRPMVLDEAKHPVPDRLKNQIVCYDRKSQNAQRRYKILKLAQVIIVGLIPLESVFPAPKPQRVTAILGLLVLIIEAGAKIKLNQD